MTPELRKAIEIVLDGFDDGTFIRDVSRDAEPGWGMRMLPYIMALSQLAKAVGR